jgi:hypothetical protein
LHNIAIIGAGQLGSRHLQGVVKSSKQFRILIVDPSENSLAVAEQRFKEVSNSTDSRVSYHQSINDLPNAIDIGIIATTANVRREIIESLLDKCLIKYLILEKVVFQKSVDFKPIQNLLLEKNVKTWVNCTRRSFLFYKKLKKELGTDKLSIKVEGNNWGLACNSIHMIDLLAFLSEQNNFIFDTDGLENILIDSKRNGFKELKGMLKIRTSRGDTLVLNDSDENDEDLRISISNGTVQIKIHDWQGILIKHTSENKSSREKFSVPFQSEQTGIIVDQILATGESDLTPYEECMQYHVPMLQAFNEHFSRATGKDVVICPIT